MIPSMGTSTRCPAEVGDRAGQPSVAGLIKLTGTEGKNGSQAGGRDDVAVLVVIAAGILLSEAKADRWPEVEVVVAVRQVVECVVALIAGDLDA